MKLYTVEKGLYGALRDSDVFKVGDVAFRNWQYSYRIYWYHLKFTSIGEYVGSLPAIYSYYDKGNFFCRKVERIRIVIC